MSRERARRKMSRSASPDGAIRTALDVDLSAAIIPSDRLPCAQIGNAGSDSGRTLTAFGFWFSVNLPDRQGSARRQADSSLHALPNHRRNHRWFFFRRSALGLSFLEKTLKKLKL